MFTINSVQRILIAIVFFAVLPALAIILVSGKENRDGSITRITSQYLEELHSFSSKNLLLAETVHIMLQALAETEAIQNADPAKSTQLLTDFTNNHTLFANLLLVSPDGKILASTSPIHSTSAFMGKAYFTKALETGMFSAGAITADPGGNEHYALPFAFPLVNKQNPNKKKDALPQVESVLIASVYIGPGLLRSTLDLLNTGATFSIKNKDGALVYLYPTVEDADSITSTRFSNIDSEFEASAWSAIRSSTSDRALVSFTDRKGDEQLITYQRLALPGETIPYMTLAIRHSKAKMFAAADEAMHRDLYRMGLVTLAAIAISLFLGRYVLILPIKKLVITAKELASGNLSARSALNLKNHKSEIGQLAATLNEMAAALELRTRELLNAKISADIANKAKSEFIANMSHEIRTPMNAILGMAFLSMKTEMSPQQRNYIGKIYSAATTLLGIVNSVLDFSKIEAGRLQMEYTEFKLEDVLDSISDLICHKADEKNINVLVGVDTNVPSTLVGDPLRLGQILTNLLGNAVKFTDYGEIIVSCSVLEHSPSKVTLRFMVKDTGIGMSAVQLTKLFTAFTQADSSITRKFGGTGLGLTITKHLVELMGGSMKVESEIDKGSAFTFTAQFNLPQQDALQAEESRSKTRVLVVDDNEAACHMLKAILLSLSFKADTVPSADEAFTMLYEADQRGEPYHIALIDWRMPGMNGIDATRHLLNNLTLSSRPSVFIVTAIGHSEVVPLAEKAGALGVLYKPINKSTLYDTLSDALRGRSDLPATFVESRGEPYSNHSDLNKHCSMIGEFVLLVEDNIINQQVAKELLENIGAIVEVAGNGKEALEKVKDSKRTPPFSLIFMDLQMPIMDGYEATKLLRKDWSSEKLPIIAVTAHAMLDDRASCLSTGMNDHITKPIEVKKLYAALQRWVPAKIAVPVYEPERATISLSLFALPQIDARTALGRLGNDERLYRKMLHQFYIFYANTPEEFYAALDSDDRTTAKRLAHTLKGLAGSIGATKLENEAAFLEFSLNDSDAPQIRSLAKSCFATQNLIFDGLRDFFIKEPPARDHPQDLPASEKNYTSDQAAKELTRLLKDNDADASRFFMAHEVTFAQILPDPLFSKCAMYIERFAFDKALALLKSVYPPS